MYEETPEMPINLNTKENKRVVQRTIARHLVNSYGDRAHLVALQNMMDETALNQEGWRDILSLIDELIGESK